MSKNLYTEILDTKTPNYYQLLGLKLFENDVDVIHKASLEQMKKLKAWDLHEGEETAKHVKEMHVQLSNAIAELEDAEKKATYDTKLSKELGVHIPKKTSIKKVQNNMNSNPAETSIPIDHSSKQESMSVFECPVCCDEIEISVDADVNNFICPSCEEKIQVPFKIQADIKEYHSKKNKKKLFIVSSIIASFLLIAGVSCFIYFSHKAEQERIKQEHLKKVVKTEEVKKKILEQAELIRNEVRNGDTYKALVKTVEEANIEKGKTENWYPSNSKEYDADKIHQDVLSKHRILASQVDNDIKQYCNDLKIASLQDFLSNMEPKKIEVEKEVKFQNENIIKDLKKNANISAHRSLLSGSLCKGPLFSASELKRVQDATKRLEKRINEQREPYLEEALSLDLKKAKNLVKESKKKIAEFEKELARTAKEKEETQRKIKELKKQAKETCEKKYSLKKIASSMGFNWPLPDTKAKVQDIEDKIEKQLDSEFKKKMPFTEFGKKVNTEIKKKFKRWKVGDFVNFTDNKGALYAGKITKISTKDITIGDKTIPYKDMPYNIMLHADKRLNQRESAKYRTEQFNEYKDKCRRYKRDNYFKVAIPVYKENNYILNPVIYKKAQSLFRKRKNYHFVRKDDYSYIWTNITPSIARQRVKDKREKLIQTALLREETKLFKELDFVQVDGEWVSKKTATRKQKQMTMIEQYYQNTHTKTKEMPSSNANEIEQIITNWESFVNKYSDSQSNKWIQKALETIKNLKDLKSMYGDEVKPIVKSGDSTTESVESVLPVKAKNEGNEKLKQIIEKFLPLAKNGNQVAKVICRLAYRTQGDVRSVHKLPIGEVKDYDKDSELLKVVITLANATPFYQTAVGLCYADGIGTDIKEEEAVKYFKKAQAKGFIPAIHYMGAAYLYGAWGVGKDVKKGYELVKKGVQHNYPQSYLLLAHAHTIKGTSFYDMEKAVKYLEIAVKNGDRSAVPILRRTREWAKIRKDIENGEKKNNQTVTTIEVEIPQKKSVIESQLGGTGKTLNSQISQLMNLYAGAEAEVSYYNDLSTVINTFEKLEKETTNAQKGTYEYRLYKSIVKPFYMSKIYTKLSIKMIRLDLNRAREAKRDADKQFQDSRRIYDRNSQYFK